MTPTLVEQIEEMRIRMYEPACSEQDLVNALGQALKRADESLLEAIRNVGLEHELRCEGIIRELRALALRMGALPAASLQDTPLHLPNYDANWQRALAPTA
jgi:hypothetical protein